MRPWPAPDSRHERRLLLQKVDAQLAPGPGDLGRGIVELEAFAAGAIDVRAVLGGSVAGVAVAAGVRSVVQAGALVPAIDTWSGCVCVGGAQREGRRTTT